jgi:hypothetical protein
MNAKVSIIFFVILIAGAASPTFIIPAAGFPVCPVKSKIPGGDPARTAVPPEGQEVSLPGIPESGRPYAWQEYNVSPEDTIWFDGFLVVGSDTLLWGEVYGWEFAWQEYNVSPEDTIWFDGFFVVGSDTLLWVDDYRWDYAWQEYNVSPADTIWFDGFLVVGSDTLLWEEVYGWEYARQLPEEMILFDYLPGFGTDTPGFKGNNGLGMRDRLLRINISGLSGDWHDPGLSPVFYYSGRYYDPFYIEFLWRNRNSIFSFQNQFFIPYIASVADWVEIAVNSSKTEKEIPLHSYYMPLPAQAPPSPAGLVQRRRPKSESPLISVIRSIFSSENEE